MERKLAHIERVLSVDSIEGADRIECLSILGWKCVAQKGQFKKDDLVVFIEPDAIVPSRPEFDFLSPSYRIKTRRFKKQISQGVCFPLSIIDNNPDIWGKYSLGDDVSSILNIQKYVPYIPAHLAGVVKGNFPEFLHKSDEERIQNVPGVLESWKGFWFLVTEKVDGTSFTCYLKDREFGVCSRNQELKETDENLYWKIAKELQLKEKLEKLNGNFALQGEIIGNGVQGNKYKLENVQLKLFNIFNIDSGKYLDQDEFVRKVGWLGLDTVPLLDQVCLDHNVEQLVELSKGNSKLNKQVPREGIVLRPEHEMYDEDLRGRLSFKVINPEFLLKFDSE